MQDDDLARLISFYNVFVRCEAPSRVSLLHDSSLEESISVSADSSLHTVVIKRFLR